MQLGERPRELEYPMCRGGSAGGLVRRYGPEGGGVVSRVVSRILSRIVSKAGKS